MMGKKEESGDVFILERKMIYNDVFRLARRVKEKGLGRLRSLPLLPQYDVMTQSQSVSVTQAIGHCFVFFSHKLNTQLLDGCPQLISILSSGSPMQKVWEPLYYNISIPLVWIFIDSTPGHNTLETDIIRTAWKLYRGQLC